MPTSPAAIYDYLQEPPPRVFDFHAATREQLLDMIEQVGNHPFLEGKTPLYPHQLAAVAFALIHTRSLLYYQMRLGKSLISLEWCQYLYYSGLLGEGRCLLICHSPVGVDVFQSECEKHAYLNTITIRSGDYAKDRFFMALADPSWHAMLISWSTIQSIFSNEGVSRKGKAKLYPNRGLLREAASAFSAVVFDEVHLAGNASSLRHQMGKEISSQAEWRLGLTGTPFGRSPMLIFGQAALVDPTVLGTSYSFFCEAFCTTKYNRFSPSHKSYEFNNKLLPTLRAKMDTIALYKTLDQVKSLSVLHGVVNLQMSPTQAASYDETVEGLRKLASGATTQVDAIFTRLRQVASGFLVFRNEAGEERTIDFVDDAKGVYLEDLIRELGDDLPPTVIFHDFIFAGRRIGKILDRCRVKYDWLHGGTKAQDRQPMVERFRSRETSILVANFQTGSLSLDMSVASLMIHWDQPVSVITRQQAQARADGRESHQVLAIDSLCAAPIDRKILQFAQDGHKLQEAMRHDPRRMAEELRRR